jgi:excisionase family DNA binding protein
MSGPHTITHRHLDRLAIVYVRQSTVMQVRDHPESTLRQYAQREDATRLGWPAAQILTIDTDLGLSGRSATGRAGFTEVVRRVCVGEVGAIFGLEISRLARSSADLQRLLEFCSLTDTLIIDGDGIYDLQNFNDRLLLGLKSTMSEAELHLLAGRLQEAKRGAARRGALRIPLPVGYVYDAAGHTVVDPHEEIRAAIADVFATFASTGSAYGVVHAFRDRPFPKRVYGGPWSGELRWGRLTHDRVLTLLANPTYTGTYVCGRYHAQRAVAPDGTIRTRIVQRPAAVWEVVIHDHHPAYLSWDAFLAHAQRLAANNTRRGAHPPREGAALLQGMVRCGGCGRAMTVSYSHGHPAYHCLTGRADQTHRPACRGVRAAAVDAAVAQAVLARVTPSAIALALAAADDVADRRVRSLRARELGVERARYDAARADRAFHQCDPDHRLVARSLEQRWEEQLRVLAEAERALAAAHHTAVTLPPRADLEALASDLPRLWHASTTAEKDRKRLLRALVTDVTLGSDPVDPVIRIGVRWRSGATETVVVPRPLGRRTSPEAIDRVRQQPDRPDEALVADLTAAGLTTGTGRPFNVKTVRWLRRVHRVAFPSPRSLTAGDVTAVAAAARLGVTEDVVYYWISQGHLEAHRDAHGHWCIPFSADVEAACHQRVLASARITGRVQPTAAGGAV